MAASWCALVRHHCSRAGNGHYGSAVADIWREARDDDERAEITQRLTEHVGAGHLTLSEFDERLRRLHEATDRGELVALTADLPAVRPSEVPAARTAAALPPGRQTPKQWLISLFGKSKLNGRWRLSGPLRSIAVFGAADIDLREAILDGRDVRVVAISFMGGQDVFLPAGIDVHLTGLAIFGGNDVHGGGPQGLPGAAVVHVRAYSLFGGTDIWRIPPGMSRSQARQELEEREDDD